MIQPLENIPIHNHGKPATEQLRETDKVDRIKSRNYGYVEDHEVDADKKRNSDHGFGEDTFEKSDEENELKDTKEEASPPMPNNGEVDITI